MLRLHTQLHAMPNFVLKHQAQNRKYIYNKRKNMQMQDGSRTSLIYKVLGIQDLAGNP